MAHDLPPAGAHPEILLREKIPVELSESKTIWKGRYRSIVDLEKRLHRCGTRVIKFFLHLSKVEQRKFWDEYMKAHEECLDATSTNTSPWHVVPADDKYTARLIVSHVVILALQDLKISYPKINSVKSSQLLELRKQLAKQ